MTVFQSVILVTLIVFSGVLGTYMVRWKRLNPYQKIFSVYLLVLFLFDATAKVFWYFSLQNLILLHVFNYIELITLTFFFISFQENRDKIILLGTSAVVLSILLFGTLYKYELGEFQVLGYFALKLFVIISSIVSLYINYRNNKNNATLLFIGLILSAVINLSVFSFGNVLANYGFAAQSSLWTLNASIFIISLLLYGLEVLRLSSWRLKKL